jgi:hypothetical protein
MKNLLRRLENNKGKIMKFLISCASLEFIVSTFYRIYNVIDSRTQIETIIKLSSMFFVFIVFTHEVLNCLVPKFIVDNLKLITHYKGKGIIYMLISFIYYSPSLGKQQNYSAYLLFSVGLVCLFADIKFDNEDIVNEELKEVQNKTLEEATQPTKFTIEKKADNPYDIPEDF